MSEEEVELRGVQALHGLVVDREVKDDEEVVRVLVDLRPLALREHVFDVERMPLEPLRELFGAGGVRQRDIDPGEAVGAELSEPRLGPRDGLADSRSATRAADEAASPFVLRGSSAWTAMARAILPGRLDMTQRRMNTRIAVSPAIDARGRYVADVEFHRLQGNRHRLTRPLMRLAGIEPTCKSPLFAIRPSTRRPRLALRDRFRPRERDRFCRPRGNRRPRTRSARPRPVSSRRAARRPRPASPDVCSAASHAGA